MGRSIFVIDDCSISLLIAKMVIKNQGFFNMVTPYSEAQQALEYIISNQNDEKSLPQVILLDLNMPIMDGWQFLNKFEELLPGLINEIDIYILSSSMDIQDIQCSKQYSSVNGYLSKPLSPEMLQNIVIDRLLTA